MKHSGGSTMICGSFRCLCRGQADLSSLMEQWALSDARDFLKENVRSSTCELKLKGKWVMQQDNDYKHTSHSILERLEKNKVNVSEWPSLKHWPSSNRNVVEGPEVSSCLSQILQFQKSWGVSYNGTQFGICNLLTDLIHYSTDRSGKEISSSCLYWLHCM